MTASDPGPDPERHTRFRDDLERALGRAFAPDERLALAVSGGPDSMAMLALAAASFPGQAIAATVDHGLRAASADEAAMVASWCAERGIDHATLTIESARDGGNLHAWARQERYRLLRQWAVDAGAVALATAHHADDQAETFLMRAARGSGLAGLSAIRMRRDDGALCLVRPLLDWRRAELRRLAMDLALPFVDDPSNADERFDRTRFRGWLESAAWIDPSQIARSAQYLAETDADLAALVAWLWTDRARPCPDGEALLDMTGLPREIRRRLARRAIDSVLRDADAETCGHDAANIETLLDALAAGKGATQAGVMASAPGDIWRFRMAPPRRPHG